MNCYVEALRGKGYKVTPRRRTIIDIFIRCARHLTPEEVWGRLRKEFNHCGLPSVYRNLETLAECGVLSRIQLFDRKKHYSLCSAKRDRHHHHITCVECGKVEDIDDCALIRKKVIKGYRVVSHFMQVDGVCSDCA